MKRKARKPSPRQEKIQKIKITTPISVCVIMKNCTKQALNLLKSLKPILVHPEDEVVIVDTGSTDGTPKKVMARGTQLVPNLRILEHPELSSTDLLDKLKEWKPELVKKFGAQRMFKNGIIRDFSKARQIGFDAANNDMCLWLDTDDVIKGEGFRALVQKYLDGGPENNAFFMAYNYAQDPEDLACTTMLWRERVVDRRKYYWAGPCHEVLIPKEEGYMGNPGLCGEQDIVIHHVHEMRAKHQYSDLRNYAILRAEIEHQQRPPAKMEREQRWVDPRLYFYMGNACRGLEEYDEALHFYSTFEPISGNPDDRVLALLYSANIYNIKQRPWRALHLFSQAEMVNPLDPRPDVGKAQCYAAMKQFNVAITHAQRAIEKARTFKSYNSMNPVQVDFLPWHITAVCAKELGDVQTALQAAEQLVRCRPNMEFARGVKQAVNNWAEAGRRAGAIRGVMGLMKSTRHATKALQNMNGLEGLEEFGLMAPERNTSDIKSGAKKLAIYCGGSWEDWGPKTPDGIGGSEQMVRDLAPKLAARGLEVTVYAPVPRDERGVHDGVTWRHHLQFNNELPRDYLLAWRNAQILDFPVPVKKRYLWLHDVGGNQLWQNQQVRALCNKAIVLSPWHRQYNSECPDNKIFVSRNAVDVDLVKKVEADERLPERNPLRFVYTSSPDRQLDRVLHAWEQGIFEKWLPEEAELIILYGFNACYMGMADRAPYINVDGYERSRMDYMEDMITKAESLRGVQFVGRMPKNGVLGIMKTSGAMLYTPSFTETFCISAAEAQCCGTVPLTTDVAALATTNKYGDKARDTKSPQAAVALLKGYLKKHENCWTPLARSHMEDKARKDFSLETLADEWMEALFDGAK